ncbi:hypothetical protein Q3V30_11705 [Erwinia pyri]|uniref:Uncharacterized protein n=1 Tax=Erwinia pyri TaxID=3062598 RepID=A0AA50DFH3_9GAMM|nr:hypothetical protein [Erwinia sp. DE2]WLS77155.1 hypothetical protein Q3V30_11705 [Erwinia sp. DE2]
MIIGNEEYLFTRGSDVVRDGMFLEVEKNGGGKHQIIAEVFYSDLSGEFTFSCFVEDAPLKVIEALIKQAKDLLPPVDSYKS